MDRVAALLLAGGRGDGFELLAGDRPKAALPVAGNYRIIDFSLSNLSYAGVRQVGIIIQYTPAPLIEHIGSGRPWEFDMADRSLRFMTPLVGVNQTQWFKGTADAIAKNLGQLDLRYTTDILILSADHVYQMDYRKTIEHHRATNADITMVSVEVHRDRQHPRFGNLQIDEAGRVLSFVEKPPAPISNDVSMGVFCFKLEVLLELLASCKPEGPEADFSLAGHVLQPHVGRLNTQAYRFDGDWFYLAGLREYFDFHMQLARGEIDLFGSDWRVMTNFSDRNLGSRPPVRLLDGAVVRNSVISPGCPVEGSVESSVLSPGVSVGTGSIVRNCVVLHDAAIGPDCRIENAIIDKDVHLERGCVIGEPGDGPLQRITVITKSSRLCEGAAVNPTSHPDMALAT